MICLEKIGIRINVYMMDLQQLITRIPKCADLTIVTMNQQKIVYKCHFLAKLLLQKI